MLDNSDLIILFYLLPQILTKFIQKTLLFANTQLLIDLLISHNIITHFLS